MSSDLCLQWKNISMTVEKKHTDWIHCKRTTVEHKILQNVSGHMESGQLIAIIGPSGAGKTSLMAAISQRYRGKLIGELLLNGIPIGRREMTKISCFVPQIDITINTLTPYEHLHFMAEFKIGYNWNKIEKQRRITSLLWQLGLEHVSHNRILTLSGGERKKLNLAADLLTNPSIIFCDEPTSGLDSFNALSVIKTFRNLTKRNTCDQLSIATGVDDELELQTFIPKSIVCSIHQPSSIIFRQFTHVLLMYAGKCIFQGTRDDALQHFSEFGFKCPDSFNPSDYYLNVLSTKNTGSAFFGPSHNKLYETFVYDKHEHEVLEAFNVKSDFRYKHISWIYQISILIYRNYLDVKRNLLNHFIYLMICLIPFYLMPIAYSSTTGRTQESIQDVKGAIFLIIAEVIFTAIYRVANTYPSIIPILRREIHEKFYQFSAYYFTEIITRIPYGFFFSYASLSIIYYFLGFVQSFSLFVWFGLTLFISTYTATAYGFLLSGITETEFLSVQISPPIDLIFLILSGVYMSLNDFPYLRYVSVFFYANESLSILFWMNVTEIECAPKYHGRCIKNGTQVLEDQSFNTNMSGVYWDYIGLFIVGSLMHMIAFFGIRRIIRKAGYY